MLGGGHPVCVCVRTEVAAAGQAVTALCSTPFARVTRLCFCPEKTQCEVNVFVCSPGAVLHFNTLTPGASTVFVLRMIRAGANCFVLIMQIITVFQFQYSVI